MTSRDGIKPTSSEWVAPEHTSDHQERPLECSVSSDRLLRVARARGGEPALPTQPTRKRQPVERNHSEQEQPRGSAGPPHEASDERHISPRSSSSVISSIRSWVRASRMVSRATTTTSLPSTPRGATSRSAARRTRRARFRCTAPPIFLPATSADPPEPGATNITTRFPCTGRPSRNTLWIAGVRTYRSAGDGEAASALAPPRGEDRPAGPRAHPQTEAVGLGPSAGVRLVGALSLGHRRIPCEKEGRLTADRRRKYTETSQDEGVDKRKSVKRPLVARVVEKPGAIVRPALPRGDGAPGESPTPRPPGCRLSTGVERFCGISDGRGIA
jgi:hypothetical protein